MPSRNFGTSSNIKTLVDGFRPIETIKIWEKDMTHAKSGIHMKLMSKLLKVFYLPICRAYARHIIGDRPADSVMHLLCSLDFWSVRGYWPNLRNPRSFEEKLCSRMLFDRNPQWTMLSDKLRMRDYVTDKVGNKYLVPLLWSGNKPEEIPFDELPLKFVIKTNHGCGYNIIVKDKTQLNQAKTIFQLNKWLGENFCQDRALGTEWAYKNIKPRIIVESFLDDNGNVPVDYKFFCFSGRTEFIQMNFDRFGDPYEKTFDRDFNPMDLWQGTKQYPGKVMRPENYEDMIRVAELLAGNLDFIRVDFYNVGGRIFVGELTCYPGGGRIVWIPRRYDFLLGEKWKSEF